MKPKIYLAGPISGLTYDGAEDWRTFVSDRLRHSVECFSPLRAKSFLRDEGVLNQSYDGNPLSTDRGIMTRDHNDCMRADLIFANLLGADRVSVGTVMEIAWAFAYRKPLVAVIEPKSNLHDHPMVREAIGFRVSSLTLGVHVARAILLPGTAL